MGWFISPAGASTFAPQIDFLYYLILAITGLAFVLVEVGIVVFAIKYRARPGRTALYAKGLVTDTLLQALGKEAAASGGAAAGHPAFYTHGSVTLEVVWTSVTAVVVVLVGVLSAPVWNQIKGRTSVPAGALAYNVVAKQFEWNVGYVGPDGQLNTADDFKVRNQLHIPVDRDVVLESTAEDVIHSFFVPAFRVKQDIVPGMHMRVWFRATKVGQFEIGCAELCGLGHYKMRAFVTVHTQEDYDKWLAERAAQAQSDAQPSAVASR